MAKIKLEFNPDRVTIGDLVRMEEGIKKAAEMREFLLMFLVNDSGRPVKGKKAIALINSMTVSEVLDSIAKLSDMAKDEIVPPPSGGS